MAITTKRPLERNLLVHSISALIQWVRVENGQKPSMRK